MCKPGANLSSDVKPGGLTPEPSSCELVKRLLILVAAHASNHSVLQDMRLHLNDYFSKALPCLFAGLQDSQDLPVPRNLSPQCSEALRVDLRPPEVAGVVGQKSFTPGAVKLGKANLVSPKSCQAAQHLFATVESLQIQEDDLPEAVQGLPAVRGGTGPLGCLRSTEVQTEGVTQVAGAMGVVKQRCLTSQLQQQPKSREHRPLPRRS